MIPYRHAAFVLGANVLACTVLGVWLACALTDPWLLAYVGAAVVLGLLGSVGLAGMHRATRSAPKRRYRRGP